MSDQNQKTDEDCNCPFCDILTQLHVKMAQTLNLLLDAFSEEFGERPSVSEMDGNLAVSACGQVVEASLAGCADPAVLGLVRINAVRLLISDVLQQRATGDAAA